MEKRRMRTNRALANRILTLVLALVLAVGSLTVLGAPVQAAKTTTAEQAADAIIKNKVKKKDSAETKLKKLFKFCRKTYKYGRVYTIGADQKQTGWKKDLDLFKSYALHMMSQKMGTCYHDAAAFAVLAKRATDLPVYIVVGTTTAFTGKKQDHAWVEVKLGKTWYICDTSADRQKKALSFFMLKKSEAKKKYYNRYKKATRLAVAF